MSVYIKNAYLLDFQIKRILVVGEYQDTSCLMLCPLFTQDTRAPPSDGPITQSVRADLQPLVLFCVVWRLLARRHCSGGVLQDSYFTEQ